MESKYREHRNARIERKYSDFTTVVSVLASKCRVNPSLFWGPQPTDPKGAAVQKKPGLNKSRLIRAGMSWQSDFVTVLQVRRGCSPWNPSDDS